MSSFNNSYNEINKPNNDKNINELSKNELIEEDKKLGNLISNTSEIAYKKDADTNSNYYIDQEAVRIVEGFGYKHEYIIKCIENNDLNHATASYYLKMKLPNE